MKSYEEILRINRYDNTGVRAPVLMAYLNCAIINKYHLKEIGIWPERNENHIKALFKTPLLPDQTKGCWEEGYKKETPYIWYQILFKYMNKDPTWVDLVKREDKQNPKLLKALLNEEKLEGNVRDPMSKDQAVLVSNTLLSPVIIRVPGFLGDLYKVVRNRPINTRAPKNLSLIHI